MCRRQRNVKRILQRTSSNKSKLFNVHNKQLTVNVDNQKPYSPRLHYAHQRVGYSQLTGGCQKWTNTAYEWCAWSCTRAVTNTKKAYFHWTKLFYMDAWKKSSIKYECYKTQSVQKWAWCDTDVRISLPQSSAEDSRGALWLSLFTEYWTGNRAGSWYAVAIFSKNSAIASSSWSSLSFFTRHWKHKTQENIRVENLVEVATQEQGVVSVEVTWDMLHLVN